MSDKTTGQVTINVGGAETRIANDNSDAQKSRPARALDLVFDQPLLVTTARFEAIVAALEHRMVEKVQAGDGFAAPQMLAERDTAIIPVMGTITHRSLGLRAMSEAMTSIQSLHRQFDQAMADADIGHIVLHVDSNGGTASGVFDFADKVFEARGKKKITAVVDEFGFSAAYAIASAADEIIIPRTGMLGSIGVMAARLDRTAQNAQDGLKYTFVYAGAQKLDHHPDTPVTRGEIERLQGEVDGLYDLFVETVARNRNLSTDAVRKTEAGAFRGQNAIDIGLADKLAPARFSIEKIIEETSTMTIEKPEASKPTLTAKEIALACQQAGLGALTPVLLDRENLTEEECDKAFATAKEIKQICAKANASDMADQMIAEGFSVGQAKEALYDVITAKRSDYNKGQQTASKLSFLSKYIDQVDATAQVGAPPIAPAAEGGKPPEQPTPWDQIIQSQFGKTLSGKTPEYL